MSWLWLIPAFVGGVAVGFLLFILKEGWAMLGKLLTGLVKAGLSGALAVLLVYYFIGPYVESGLVSVAKFSAVMPYLSTLYSGGTPAYPDQMTNDVTTAWKQILDAALPLEGITLAAGDIGTLLGAINTRLIAVYPPTAA